jgi:cyanophycinase
VRRANKPATAPNSTVILIGGTEDKSGERTILREIARRAHGGPLAICTAGSAIPAELFQTYGSVFRELAVRDLLHVSITNRGDAENPKTVAAIAQSKVFFFSGGDQLRITSMLAGSRLYSAVRELYARGGTVAGTSAGASALGHTMPMSTEAAEHKVAAAWQLVPGLGLLDQVIVDQHFAQRGRMGRLVAGVVENPRLMGVGIDENTGLIWNGSSFRAIGSGAVYVVDGRQVTRSNLGEARAQTAISAFDIRLHVLSAGDCFDMPAYVARFAALCKWPSIRTNVPQISTGD